MLTVSINAFLQTVQYNFKDRVTFVKAFYSYMKILENYNSVSGMLQDIIESYY